MSSVTRFISCTAPQIQLARTGDTRFIRFNPGHNAQYGAYFGSALMFLVAWLIFSLSSYFVRLTHYKRYSGSGGCRRRKYPKNKNPFPVNRNNRYTTCTGRSIYYYITTPEVQKRIFQKFLPRFNRYHFYPFSSGNTQFRLFSIFLRFGLCFSNRSVYNGICWVTKHF